MPLKLVVLLSGSGTTLQNLIDRIAARKLEAEIVLVVSSRAGSFGLERARQAGLPTAEIIKKGSTIEAFGQKMYELLRSTSHDLVVLAGFLEFLPIPQDFTHRVINIHPSLIPAFSGKGFYGRRVHEAALAAGVKVSGCTVHYADNEFDHGPILLQKVVPVLDGDSPDTLAARVFEAECDALPEAITLISRKQVRIEGHRVVRRQNP